MALSPSIRHIERAQLKSQELQFGALKRLAQPCLNWCHEYVQCAPNAGEVAQAFRSGLLAQAAHRVFPSSCHTEFTADLTERFAEFVQLREKAAAVTHISLQETGRELQRPQALLLVDWSASLFDGALTPETQGFLDDDSMPPWDTWISLVKVQESHGLGCLLTWVPHWLASQIDFAIRVDAAECLSWARVRDDGELLVNGWGRRWEAQI